MTWRIVRTAHGKEHDVESGVRRLNVDVRTWIPELMIVIRPRQCAGRTKPPRRVYRLPLPGCIFVQMAIADMAALQRIDRFEEVWRDAADVPVAVPDWQVDVFMAAVADHNARQDAYFRHLTTAKASKRPERFRGFDRLAEALQARQAMDEAL